MAGSLTASVHRGNAEASETSRWLISFARFIPFPSPPSPYPGLVPLGKRELSSSPIGTWLSTSFSKVYLTLVDEVNGSDAILSVELAGKILEEHYISKLNFSWPHMTCVSGFPSRGSRAILVSYMDSENEIQKFALRFSTCDAAVTFVAALKEKLSGFEEAGIQERETRPEASFQSDYNPGNEIIPSYVPEMLPRLECQQSLYPQQFATEEEPNMVKPPESYVLEMQPRLEYQTCQTFYEPQIATVEEPTMVKHIGSYVPEMQPRLGYQAGQTLYPPHATLSQIPNDPFINLPPSFTTLLSGCFPNSSLDAGQATVKQDPDLKSQILKHMEDSSFQDMLQKVERIMEEIGGNWIL
ncbi:protein POOR HOMOLOGOUS SYNAPSIS 1 isoform X2 [Brassica napus]|uniref:protein POOR HOMOLOGOUS SYNAPSIS 1 isoform X2 n=1 Tax=Brassica napus TaxID=3708 RepID=UPI0006AABBA0|nr:protein POOR HOMOLOGOUS SYNAPSIS 1 isoform X2 [Brassica napus]